MVLTEFLGVVWTTLWVQDGQRSQDAEKPTKLTFPDTRRTHGQKSRDGAHLFWRIVAVYAKVLMCGIFQPPWKATTAPELLSQPFFPDNQATPSAGDW